MQSRLRALEDTETRLLNEIDKILPLHREFVELHDLYNDMQAQLSSMQSVVRERAEEEARLKVEIYKMEGYIQKVQEGHIGLLVKVAELRPERTRLEEWLQEQNLVKKDLEEALRMQRPPLLPRRKTIVIDLNGLLMKVGRCREDLAAAGRLGYDILPTAYTKTWFVPRPGMAGFLRRCMEWFNVIIWTSRQERNLAVILKKCHMMGFLPTDFKRKAPMDERDEYFLWSNCTAADRQKFMVELNGHRIQRAGQKAMPFAMADADQPSQTQDGAGASNRSQTAATEIGQPIVPTPLSAASLISDAEFLLAVCRDEDMELTRLHGAL
ncbi:hypothetical protein R1sor_015779 [Riccia sorocarpa]|uniref:Mitochondrial import inner membrane translocase subunit TIM50 n=1 Tax=Riccia sorocarpa TaxID=122646 RepID=A0ABD3HGK1_9MARC